MNRPVEQSNKTKSMSFRLPILVFLSVSSLAFGATPASLAGSLDEGAKCSAPYQCIEPFYCLPDGNDFKCALKSCAAADQCSIGQFCDKSSGKCAVKDCKEDKECAGQTVCQVNGKCGSKSNKGQSCTRDEQCWSKSCEDDKCGDGDGSGGNVVDGVVDAGGDIVDGATGAVSDTVDGAMNLGKRIGGGGIVGIILGILFVLALIAACCYFFIFARRKLSSNN